MNTENLRGLTAAVRLLGGKWKLLILGHLTDGDRRYGELRRLIPEISEKMLIQQLRELEADGMVRRTVFESIPPHVEYGMTEHAYSLCPIVQALTEWGKQHLKQQEAGEAKSAQ